MAITKIITINQIIQMFTDFQEKHIQLQSIGYGPTYNISTTTSVEYPLLWITHKNTSRFELKNRNITPVLSLTFIILDIINDQNDSKVINGIDSSNEQEVTSDTYQIAQDLVSYISTELTKYGVKIREDFGATLEPVYNETEDKASGWMIDIDLQLVHSNCIYPTKL
ncbi:MAG: Unknown protein [uncultured Sulfurovum sp.]|uniref:Uncharacterized protein n=1 Tax=uncultured Sulfurovum sp. TaxID=269237 RepID=A0A6S6T5I1_9BACT|nr:MAG: Unknown protein [uncultured Sulfurovum sp.]